jgi:tetratricopeptide (TPR) repeat protein
VSCPAVRGAHCRACGDFAGAEPLLREALALAEAALPHGDQTLALALNELGLLCKDLGRWDEAHAHSQRAMARLDQNPAADPDDLADAAGGAVAAGEAMAVLQATLEPGHPRLVACAGTAWGGVA